MTDNKCYNDIYAITTILTPSTKLRLFKTKDWQGDIHYARRYRGQLEKEFWHCRRRLSDNNGPLLPGVLAGSLNTRLRHIVRLGCGSHIQVRKSRRLDIGARSKSNCRYLFDVQQYVLDIQQISVLA